MAGLSLDPLDERRADRVLYAAYEQRTAVTARLLPSVRPADGASAGNSLSATTPGGSAAQTITAVEAAAAFSHGVAYAVYGGNTYLAQSASGMLAPTDTTIVELIGVHSFTASTGYVTLAS